MPGPLLFICYMNYLDSGISSNTKIGRQISSEQEAIVLQSELNRMHEWTVKWQMGFNINKCSTLHVGRHITGNLKPREQCISAKNRANRVLGFITRSVSNRSADVILRLYLVLVWPHLDYAVQFWSPYYRMDIDKLEAMQRRRTKMIKG